MYATYVILGVFDKYNLIVLITMYLTVLLDAIWLLSIVTSLLYEFRARNK